MFKNQNLNAARYGVFERLQSTAFQQQWQWVLEIKQKPGAREISPMPNNFAIFVKDISYGAIEIDTEAKNVGGGVLTLPTRAQPVAMSMTIRDNQEGVMFDYFQTWAGQVVSDNGTVSVAQEYLRTCSRYQLVETSGGQLQKKDSPGRSWDMFPTVVGDISETIEDRTGLLEFPVTCMQSYSI